ncbi:hypothetical protein BJ912DRAFT_1147750 [Pholiota molesta]|nr:hypothetical protein BJ912DRAFT_1147750 [Pholiota molesta]
MHERVAVSTPSGHVTTPNAIQALDTRYYLAWPMRLHQQKSQTRKEGARPQDGGATHVPGCMPPFEDVFERSPPAAGAAHQLASGATEIAITCASAPHHAKRARAPAFVCTYSRDASVLGISARGEIDHPVGPSWVPHRTWQSLCISHALLSPLPIYHTTTNKSSQPRSPMNEVPAEILCEILARCVDLSSARVLMQPSTSIAPMSLCHVCATWRAIVLATPSFWSHLRFELPLDWHANGRPYTGDPALFARRVEWLRWWRGNLGALAPSLQVELRRTEGAKYRRGRVPAAAADFLLELLSSAQYISVGRLYRYLVQRHQEAGYVVATHPRAHTLIATWTSVTEFGGLAAYSQYLQSVVPQATSTTLRCIAIDHAELGPQDFAITTNDWSMLTHLSTLTALVPLKGWFSFIRCLCALQSGSFRLSFLDKDIVHYTRPSVCTLPCLTVLHIDAAQHRRDRGQYPLRAAFAHLQLPALRTLSLNSRARTWYGATAFDDVEAALLAAPAVAKLVLGRYFLSGRGIPPPRRSSTRPGILSRPSRGVRRASNACAFRWRVRSRRKCGRALYGEVTFVASATSRPVDMGVEHAERSLLMAEVQKCVGDEVVVGFEDEEVDEAPRITNAWRLMMHEASMIVDDAYVGPDRSEDGRLVPREDSEAQSKIVADRRDSQLVVEVKAKRIAAGGCSARGRRALGRQKVAKRSEPDGRSEQVSARHTRDTSGDSADTTFCVRWDNRPNEGLVLSVLRRQSLTQHDRPMRMNCVSPLTTRTPSPSLRTTDTALAVFRGVEMQTGR